MIITLKKIEFKRKKNTQGKKGKFIKDILNQKNK